MATNMPVTPDTPITIKVAIQGANRKFRIPLKDLSASVLPDKLRTLLQIPNGEVVVFERYSDSAGAFVVLDPANPQVFKTLFRAAKAKLKLRLKATLPNSPEKPVTTPKENSPSPPAFPRMARPVSMSVLGGPASGFNSAMTSVTTLTDMRQYDKARGGQRLAPMASQVELSSQKATTPAFHSEAEAPLPKPFIDEASSRDAAIAFLLNREGRKKPEMPKQTLPVRQKEWSPSLNSMKEAIAALPNQAASWSVYCNACDKVMANEHYHCSVCDEGDYDLCNTCVEAGLHCPGKDHWLVKRFVQQGSVVSSTTERVGPKKAAVAELKSTVKRRESTREMPGAFKEEKKADEFPLPTRTCNSCVREFPENEFVHCQVCEDYDLCIGCHVEAKHGHHPGHAFERATPDTLIGPLAEFLCAPGRNVRHQALCDGCDKFVFGVRHKCLDCPDWDYCSQCVKNASLIHPGHRFVALYDPINERQRTQHLHHHGIFCDGHLCKDSEKQSYIRGIRYKCAVCNDTDFCQNCEASPVNKHNPTHPLIKFKTPVRNVMVTTLNEDHKTSVRRTFGDVNSHSPTAVDKSAQEKSPVKTIVDIKPIVEPPSKPAKEKIEIKDLLADPIDEKLKIESLLILPKPEEELGDVHAAPAEPKALVTPAYDAEYVRDTMADGTKIMPGQRFTQIWVLRNPGPVDWPAGCCVKYVGGDNMLNRDAVFSSIGHATESSTVRRPVKVGEEVAFSVVMKAPKRTGTAISYWRLKSPQGVPFGHRLWCHVDVVNRNPTVEDVPEVPTAAPAVTSSARPHSMKGYTWACSSGPTTSAQDRTPTQMRSPPRPVSMMPTVPPFPPVKAGRPIPQWATAPGVPLYAPGPFPAFSNAMEVQPSEHIQSGPKVRPPHAPQVFPDPPSVPASSAYPHVPNRPGFIPRTLSRDQAVNHILQDYQLQIMLLEQQNEKRLLMARQEMDRVATEAKTTAEKGKAPAIASPIPPPPPAGFSESYMAAFGRMMAAKKPVARSEEAGSSRSVDVAAKVLAEQPQKETKKVVMESSPKLERVDSEKTSTSKAESSKMIFPTLEKESPSSSTHEAVTAPSSIKAMSMGLASPSTVKSEPQLFEDAESVDLSDASFLTDEEYDILDASDEESI